MTKDKYGVLVKNADKGNSGISRLATTSPPLKPPPPKEPIIQPKHVNHSAAVVYKWPSYISESDLTEIDLQESEITRGQKEKENNENTSVNLKTKVKTWLCCSVNDTK
ncbi:uncharacterized protein LOC113226280 [Hyposmocoma kahamanoa]|uniref:uncharacterized protein LOC113226280 n=1 Tax=Hyposmocoma kahamanoa TaxID=1477025 RepID=UPI000E6D7CD6|nr:uncharacterized protein LOC113226280 [Hyposmocoma kahamanoa]